MAETSVVYQITLQAHEMYERWHAFGPEVLAGAFQPLRDQVAGLGREDLQSLRSGIGSAALRDEFPYPGEGGVVMELLLGTDDRRRLDATRILFEFFEQQAGGRRRRREFHLTAMKELVVQTNNWLFRRPETDETQRIRRAKQELADFLISVAGDGIVADVLESEGLHEQDELLDELSSMLRPPTAVEFRQRITDAENEIGGLWESLMHASFDEGDDLIARLMSTKHSAEETEREFWNGFDFVEPEPADREETRGHVLLALAATFCDDAENIGSTSHQEAKRRRAAAAKKDKDIRQAQAEPAKNDAEADAKTRRLAQLRRQRDRSLALAQEAAGREQSFLTRAENYEQRAGAIIDRLTERRSNGND